MKPFIAVIIVAIVIGNFVGAELVDSSFSITGAVVGGGVGVVGAAAVLLALRAFFDAQERKRKEKALRRTEEQKQIRREIQRKARVRAYEQQRREIEQKAPEAEIRERERGRSYQEEKREQRSSRAKQFAQQMYGNGRPRPGHRPL